MKALISFCIVVLFFFQPIAFASEQDVYARVIETNKLRCGYVVWEPMFMKDPNTGVLSGIFYEYVEALGERLGIEIEWAEEVLPATYVEALRLGRVDALCSGDWPDSTRGKFLTYTRPVFYLALMPYTKAGDLRFDNTPDAMNTPEVTFSIIEGEMSSIIVKQDFPKAKTLSLPIFSDGSQMLLNVVDQKADVAIAAVSTAKKFMKHNPGQLREVKLSRPVRLFPNTLSVALDNAKLREVLDVGTQELLNSGEIETILQRYEESPDMFYRVARPYERPELHKSNKK